MLYRGMDKAALDAAYNNTAAVGQAKRDRYLADWTTRTAELMKAVNAKVDLRYGKGARHRIDFYPCGAKNAPTLVFIHGGYWQMSDKENYGFVAEGPLAHGINVAAVEYTLTPAIKMDGIVAEVKLAVSWIIENLGDLGAATDGVYVTGHSAGGHLTAMVAAERGVRGCLPISGLFDLEPIRLSYLNDKVQMDEMEAKRNSPILHLPDSLPPSIVTVGAEELPELRRQSEEYYRALAKKGFKTRYLPLAGHEHFSILEELATPKGKLTAAVKDLIAGRV